MSNQTTRRLLSELAAFESEPNGIISLAPESDSNLFTWTALLAPPLDTPYAHIMSSSKSPWPLPLKLKIPTNYPACPPVITFPPGLIYHPNVNLKTGEICLDVLKDQWTPVWRLEGAIRAIGVLIGPGGSEPNSPLNVDAANLAREGDELALRSIAKMYMSRYILGSSIREGE